MPPTRFFFNEVMGSLIPEWDPAVDLPDLLAWWRADEEVFQDAAGTIPALTTGDPVRFWGDLTGNGEDVSIGTVPNAPYLLGGAGALNGHHLLRFGGPSVRLERTSTVIGALTGPYTLAAVFRHLDPAGVGTIAGASTGSNMPVMLSQGGSNTNLGMWQSGAGPTLSGNTLLLEGAAYMVVAQRSGTTGAWNLTLRLNGASDGTMVSAINAVANTSFAIGRFGGFSSKYWVGDIAEVLICDSALELSTVLALEAYLANRYRIGA